MYAWPGLCKVGENHLIAIATERKYHVCPFGRLVIMRSEDGGDTWTQPHEIYNSELDDRDPAIVAMADGTLVVGFPTTHEFANPRWSRPEWQDRIDRLSEQTINEVDGDWCIRSTDGGTTWESTPHRMPNGGSEHSGPFSLSDGSLGCFGYELADDDITVFYYRSSDLGNTWDRMGRLPHGHVVGTEWPWRLARGGTLRGPTINERALIEIEPQHFLSMFRSEPDGLLRQFRTTDGGATWCAEENQSVWGFPPHLLRLSGGAILCSFSHRADPWSIQAMLSYDEGKSWDIENRIMVHKWSDKPDMGYPVALEVSPGEILTVFYASRRDRTPDWFRKYGEHGILNSSQLSPGPDGILFKKYKLS
jgi:hypothetical protein